MPDLDAYLHYRIVDVSSVKELARRWYPRAYFNAPAKNGGHRALADIRESIRSCAITARRCSSPHPDRTPPVHGRLPPRSAQRRAPEPPPA